MPKKSDKELIQAWEAKVKKKLEGRKIVEVRYLTEKEKDDAGFYHRSLVLFMDDGSYIFPQSDDEGNDAGAFCTSWEDMPIIPVI